MIHGRTTKKPVKPVEDPNFHKTGNTKDSNLEKYKGGTTKT